VYRIAIGYGALSNEDNLCAIGGQTPATSVHLAIFENREFRWYDNGNYVGFEAPALEADQIWVLPDTDGAANSCLMSDGGGNLSWSQPLGVGNSPAFLGAKLGGDTNYATFDADGKLTLTSTARVISGDWIDAQAIRAPASNPAELISHGVLETPAFQFADAIEALQESVTFNMRIPNRLDRAAAPNILVGWSADGISPGNCRWQLGYLYTKPGDDTGAAAQDTVAVTSTASATVDGMVIATFPAMDLPEATDICVHCRITRLSADVLDTIADTVELHGVCLSFTSDKLGTAI